MLQVVRPGLPHATAYRCRRQRSLTFAASSPFESFHSVTPALMAIKPFMPIQFINPLEITLVCWVSEFNTRFIAK